MHTITTNISRTAPLWRKPTSFNLTPLGTAERFVYEHGNNIRYCQPWGQWLVWNGQRWCRDESSEVHRLAVETVRSIRKHAKSVSDEDLRAKMEVHSRRCETSNSLDGILSLAEKQAGIPILPGEFDRDGMLFNCPNGTIDLRTGLLRSHSREDLITKISLVEYRPNEECPTWLNFLNQILNDDAALIDFMQKAIGYSLTGDVTEKALFFLHGKGDNGKTTLVEAVRRIMGEYAGAVDIEALMKKASNSDKERATADLAGKRFATSSEAGQGETLHEARIKHLTGMGRLVGRRIYGASFEFDPQFKLFIDANHKPHISGTDQAIWNRLRLIPFNVSIPKDQQDKSLLVKLAAESPGILAWAVQGCLRWRAEGLGAPVAVAQATESYRDEMDPVADFVAECCDDEPEATETFSDLYKV